MNLLDIFLLALAMSVDAFVVSFSYGLIIKKGKGKAALKLGTATGLGQFIMPVLGFFGAGMIYNYIEALDHWIAFFVFLVLGIKIISEAFKNCNCKIPKTSKVLSLKILLMIGLATSIDAFVSGAMLYFIKAPIWSSALIIGVVTFINACIGFNLCRMFKNFPMKYLEIFSGLILILLGTKVLVEHLAA